MKKWLRDQKWEATDTGWFLTLSIFMTVQWAAFQPANNGKLYKNKFDEFVHLKPSEMGDTLAGAFSALAFVWIIVTVFMQARELREQRAVFLLQKDEMEEQRKATQDMARAMAVQARIFEAEEKARLQNAARKVLDNYLEQLAHYVEKVQGNWMWEVDFRFPMTDRLGKETGEFSERTSPRSLFATFNESVSSAKPTEFLRSKSRQIANAKSEIEGFLEGRASYGRVTNVHKALGRDELALLKEKVGSVLELEDRLSDADAIFLSNTELGIMKSALEEILQLDVWLSESESDLQ